MINTMFIVRKGLEQLNVKHFRRFVRLKATMSGDGHIGKFCLSEHVHRGQPPVTVIILGWAWSKDYQVERFAKLHRELGHHTLTYILDPKLLFTLDYKAQREISENLVAQLKENAPDIKDVILHGFSNNGYCLYQHLGDLITADSELRLRGAMLDSAPGPWNARSYLIHPKYAENGENVVFPLLAYMYLHLMEEKKGIIAAFRAGWKLWPTLKANWTAYISFHSSPGYHLLRERLQHPLMLLFSPGDMQMPASFIRYAAQKQRSLGRKVIEEDFGRSGHVAHHKSDPERYKKCVQGFVQESMKLKGKL